MLNYRQPHEPFQGDPRAELLAEIEDALNYVEECARQDVLTAWGATEIDLKLRECVAILQQDDERRRRERGLRHRDNSPNLDINRAED